LVRSESAENGGYFSRTEIETVMVNGNGKEKINRRGEENDL